MKHFQQPLFIQQASHYFLLFIYYTNHWWKKPRIAILVLFLVFLLIKGKPRYESEKWSFRDLDADTRE